MNISKTQLAVTFAIATLAGAAYAQTPATVAAGPVNKAVLEEVVVTAQRRDENAQDVPIAMQAFNAKALEELGITDSMGLNHAVPGLAFSRSLVSAAPFIRGVGSDYSNIGGESPVAFYIDDVYRASAAGGFFELDNIESITVLKGPQGTLFGRNATGGVISATTRGPGESFGGRAKVEVGNFGRVVANLNVTGPLSENIAGTFNAYSLTRDGYGKNNVTGNEAYYNRNKHYEGKLKFDLGEGTTIRVAADWGKEDIPVPFSWRPGILSGATGTALYTGDFNIVANRDDTDVVTQYGLSVRLSHDFDAAEFRSITAFRTVRLDASQDNDRTPLEVSIKEIHSVDKSYTQEFQLVSPASSRVKWIGGLFFLEDKASYPGETSYVATTTQKTVSTLEQATTSYALFGQATFPLSESGNLTAGFRYSVDDRTSYDFERFIPTDVLDGPATGEATTFSGQASHSWSSPTWRLSYDHAFTPDVMGYVSYNRGFKSGLFNLIPFNPTPVNPETLDAYEVGFKSQLFDSRLRLNASFFHYNYDDMQVVVQTPNPATGLTQSGVINAASSKIDGFEFDFQWIVTDNFYIRGGFNYTDGEYESFENAPSYIPQPSGGNARTTIDASGTPLLRTPKTSYNIAPVFLIPTNSGNVRLFGNFSYKAEIFYDVGHLNNQESTETINLGADWTDLSEKWTASVFVRNLNDEHIYQKLSLGPPGLVAVPGEPRTYGVSLSRKFGAY